MAGKKNKTIFIVDDDSFFSNLLTHGIEKKLGIKVRSFLEPMSLFLDLTKGETADLIFLDYNFEGYDNSSLTGLEILKKIKMINPLQTVIMVSGETDPEILMKSTREGAYGYIVKSELSFSTIINLIRNYYYKSGNEI
jgi:two-component system response regulator AtoC